MTEQTSEAVEAWMHDLDPLERAQGGLTDAPKFIRCDACDGEGSIPEHDGACDAWMVFPCHKCRGAGEVRDVR